MSLCPAKALERQIQHEMLINALAYEKMNDLKDASDKSSQKWLCQVDHHDETLWIGNTLLNDRECFDEDELVNIYNVV